MAKAKYNKYLLSGLLQCGKCKSSMKVIKRNNIYYYVCSGRYNNTTDCDQKYLNMYESDEVVIHNIDIAVRKELNLIKSGEKISTTEEIENVEKEIDQMFEMSNGEILHYQLLKEELSKYKELVMKLKNQSKSKISFERYKDALEKWNKIDKTNVDSLKEITKSFIDSIVVTDDEYKINLKC